MTSSITYISSFKHLQASTYVIKRIHYFLNWDRSKKRWPCCNGAWSEQMHGPGREGLIAENCAPRVPTCASDFGTRLPEQDAQRISRSTTEQKGPRISLDRLFEQGNISCLLLLGLEFFTVVEMHPPSFEPGHKTGSPAKLFEMDSSTIGSHTLEYFSLPPQ
jgi:hypothetical protein